MGRCGDVSDYAVEQVRDLVLQLAELDADYMRNNGSIQDQNSKNLYYAMTTRKSALMARELPQILGALQESHPNRNRTARKSIPRCG
jgi:hypothetical protein